MKHIAVSIILTVLCINISAWAINNDESLMLYLPFDKDDGDKSIDASGNDLEAVFHGATWSKDGKIGGCIHLADTEKYVEIAAVPELDITDAITIQTWFLPEQNQGDSNLMGRRTGGNVGGYCLQWSSNPTKSPQIETWMYVGKWQGSRSKQTIKPDLNEWHHVASTYDGDKVRQYIDGKLDVEYSAPGKLNSVDIVFRIGRSQTPLAGTVGYVDEVAIYNRALSEDEVNEDMNKGVFFAVDPSGKLATTWANLKM